MINLLLYYLIIQKKSNVFRIWKQLLRDFWATKKKFYSLFVVNEKSPILAISLVLILTSMAHHYTSDVSDGEIVGDLSEISSEEDNYFENMKKRLQSRKIELELENSFAGQFGESAVLLKYFKLV